MIDPTALWIDRLVTGAILLAAVGLALALWRRRP